jgi:hypothetical protein
MKKKQQQGVFVFTWKHFHVFSSPVHPPFAWILNKQQPLPSQRSTHFYNTNHKWETLCSLCVYLINLKVNNWPFPQDAKWHWR